MVPLSGALCCLQQLMQEPLSPSWLHRNDQDPFRCSQSPRPTHLSQPWGDCRPLQCIPISLDDSRQSLPLQFTEPGLQVLSWRRSQMKTQRRGEHA
ncbi:hypothetical protein PC128_g24223 [Phytophthora cactorum]|nr:hypothetical protein PC128_g24223 [Phytophthora cactorum]